MTGPPCQRPILRQSCPEEGLRGRDEGGFFTKYLFQFARILAFCFLGEFCHAVLPLPFDINAPVIDIPDDDYGIWYMDCQDEPQKYAGKTVKFLAQVCQTNRAGKNSFVPGRFAMTCCVQDIQFVGFPCSYDGYKALEQRA